MYFCHIAILQKNNELSMPDRETGSCLDPKLPGTGLQVRRKRAWPAQSWLKSQLEPSRDEGTMRRGKEESIPDMMKEDQRPTE
jgi:hypothetical protein